MYRVMVTPPLVYVKVESSLASRNVANLCEELIMEHQRLDGDYDSIFIDLAGAFDFDLNFRNETRFFLQMIREKHKQLFLLNAPEKVTAAVNKQGLSQLLKIKNLEIKIGAPDKEFNEEAKAVLKAERLPVLLGPITGKVFSSIGCNESLLQSPAPMLAIKDRLSVCEMVNDDHTLGLGIRFTNLTVLSGLMMKIAKGTPIDENSMQRWADEILNMFVSQIATSQDNQKWNLTKVGQPGPLAEKKGWSEDQFAKFLAPEFQALGVELVYSVKSKANGASSETLNEESRNLKIGR